MLPPHYASSPFNERPVSRKRAFCFQKPENMLTLFELHERNMLNSIFRDITAAQMFRYCSFRYLHRDFLPGIKFCRYVFRKNNRAVLSHNSFKLNNRIGVFHQPGLTQCNDNECTFIENATDAEKMLGET